MFDHTGHNCAFCHKPLQAGDDVVVCPECGAPYHRECYQKAGNCVFAEKHGTDFEWQPEPGTGPKPEEITCPNCGASTPADSQFCKQCGSALKPGTGAAGQNTAPHEQPRANSEEQSRWNWQMGFMASQFNPTEPMNGIALKDWANHIGRSVPYYLSMFMQLEATGRKVAFSPSALLFGPLYFFFRKMWKWGAIFFGLEFLVSLPSLLYILVASGSAFTGSLSLEALSSVMMVAYFLNLVLAIVRAMVAVPLYRKHSLQHLKLIHRKYPAGIQRDQATVMAGGTSMGAVLLFILAQTILYVLLITQLSGPGLMNVLYSMYM